MAMESAQQLADLGYDVAVISHYTKPIDAATTLFFAEEFLILSLRWRTMHCGEYGSSVVELLNEHQIQT